MRVFITGGNGFIGSVVVRRLAAAGHDAACLLRPTSRTERIDGVRYERVVGDVRDSESIRRGMAGCDCTMHLAAPGGWGADDPAELYAVIEDGTRNVLAVAGERLDHRVVIVSSTAAVAASDEPRVFDETAPFSVGDARLHYAHAKHRAEEIARAAHASGVPVVIVNPAEVYGPGDTALGTARNLIDFATSGIVLVTAGGTGIVHVDDVADGILAALERGRAGERYILAGENVTVRALAEMVLAWQGRRAPIIAVPRVLARAVARTALALHVPLPYEASVVPYATRYWFVGNAKARRELGVTFRGARETIVPTLEWLRDAGYVTGVSTVGDLFSRGSGARFGE